MVMIHKENTSLPEVQVTTGTVVTLNTLQPGQIATIVDIQAEASLKMHLLELGFVAGSSITFLMTTPFGDPNIYALRGTSIALRKREALCIRVLI